MADPALTGNEIPRSMPVTVELSLLSLIAAAAGVFALSVGDWAFAVIFAMMSGLALRHVFRASE
jgi:hypothetical protein